MIQIRRKKEQQRQSIRREFLDNHFREMRKRCFNFGNTNQIHSNPSDCQQSIFEFLLNESLKFNCLAIKIRQSNLLQQLEYLVNEAINAQNLHEKKFLLTIISNIFYDQLEVDEKVTLYRLSAKLFESLNLSYFNRESQKEREDFEKVIKVFRVQILLFYMFTANSVSRFLDEQDQIRIQEKIYPAFSHVLFYGMNIPEEIQKIDEFQSDVYKFFQNIYDTEEEFYEQGNRMKAERLMPFYAQILQGHLWQVKNNDIFQECFSGIEFTLLRCYHNVMEVFSDVPDIFRNNQIFKIMEFTIRKETKKANEKELNYVYSLLHSFVDKKIFLQQVEILLLTKDRENNFTAFQKAIKSVMENSDARYRAIEMIQGVIVCFFEENEFRQIVQDFDIPLVDMCAQIVNRFEKTMMGNGKNRKFLFRTLTIIRVMLEKEKILGQTQDKGILKRFQSQSGIKALEQISAQFHEIDYGDDMEIFDSIQLIEQIILQTFEAQF